MITVQQIMGKKQSVTTVAALKNVWQTVNHNLGVKPQFVLFCQAEATQGNYAAKFSTATVNTIDVIGSSATPVVCRVLCIGGAE